MQATYLHKPLVLEVKTLHLTWTLAIHNFQCFTPPSHAVPPVLFGHEIAGNGIHWLITTTRPFTLCVDEEINFMQLCFVYTYKYFTTIVSIGWGFVCSDKRCHLLLVLFLNSLERSLLLGVTWAQWPPTWSNVLMYARYIMLCILVIFKSRAETFKQALNRKKAFIFQLSISHSSKAQLEKMELFKGSHEKWLAVGLGA